MRKLCSALAVALLASALVGSAPASVAAAGTCSATGLESPPANQDGLTDAVARMRNRIVRAAVNCRYRRLQELAKNGRKHFSFSFSAERSPARYWRQLEEQGEDPLAKLVKLFNAPFVRGSEAYPDSKRGRRDYIWPSAFQPNPTNEDWNALEATGAYTEKEMRWFKRHGYLGYRTFIKRDGDWTVFIAGD